MTGSELKQRRKKLNFTQRSLAKKLGVTQATVWRWESEQIQIQNPEMLDLALQMLEKGLNGKNKLPSK